MRTQGHGALSPQPVGTSGQLGKELLCAELDSVNRTARITEERVQSGGHVQRACSVGSVDGASAALAHQLPRVASSTSCAGLPQGAAT